ALCLSGGGIRSATFNLGVLQGLARAGILEKFDYLSSVSGGGYIAGWLKAWMSREGTRAVLDALRPSSQLADGPPPSGRDASNEGHLGPRGNEGHLGPRGNGRAARINPLAP